MTSFRPAAGRARASRRTERALAPDRLGAGVAGEDVQTSVRTAPTTTRALEQRSATAPGARRAATPRASVDHREAREPTQPQRSRRRSSWVSISSRARAAMPRTGLAVEEVLAAQVGRPDRRRARPGPATRVDPAQPVAPATAARRTRRATDGRQAGRRPRPRGRRGVQREPVDLHVWVTVPPLGMVQRSTRVSAVRPDYTDDLRLAHVLADDADSLTTRRFKALDLHVMTKPDLTPVTDADQAVEEGIRRTLSRVRLARRGHRRGAGHDRAQPAALGRRPDRRHQELRPRRAGLGHADRAGRRRRGGARRGVGAAAAAALVGLDRQRRLDRPVAAQGDPVPGLRRTPARGRLALLRLAARLGGARPARRLPLADAPVLAHPRLRRLLVLHAGRRGRGRHRRRARARGLRHGGARRDRARGRRHGSPRSTAPTARGAATRWPPTATCTTPRCRSWARCPTTTATPTGGPPAPARCRSCAPAARPDDAGTPGDSRP